MMKYIKILTALFFALFAFQFSNAQSPIKDSIMVNGNCGMCKKTIEKSAKEAGAATAIWNKDSKFLQVSYDPAKTNSSKIQSAIAKSGYDTQDMKATDEAYKGLEECCQYERKELLLKKQKP